MDHKHNSAGGDLPLAMPCNEPAEQVISLLVLYKYFVLSGPGRPDPEVCRYISG